MKITNELGLPDAIFRAVAADPYTKGNADYSVTQLLKPPRMVALEREHAHELTEDCADRIWSLLGQVVHGILERAESVAIPEERWYCDILGKRISGGMDRLVLKEGLLQDYKFTTAWKFSDGVPKEFIEQLNSYAWILRENGIDVRRAQIVAILRDWSKPHAARDVTYPRHQCLLLDVPLWAPEEQLRFLEERVRLHELAKTAKPLCSEEEMWASQTIYAVMKQGQKKATKLFDDEFLAEAHAAGLSAEGKGVYNVVARPGERKRCSTYCSVAAYCNQNIILLQEGK